MKIVVEFGDNLLKAIKDISNTETPGRCISEAFGINVSHLTSLAIMSAQLSGDKNINIVMDLSKLPDYIISLQGG